MMVLARHHEVAEPESKSTNKPMTRKPRTEQELELALSDEAAAYIANALMQLALDFESNHFAQIRRHYLENEPEPDNDPRQLDLFHGNRPD